MCKFLLLAMCYSLLTACGMGKVMNYILEDPPPRSPSAPLRDSETGEVIKMWIPKNASVNATWEFQARGEESRCSDGYYIGKNIRDLLPSKRETYKILLRYGNRIWAYYYGEDSPLATGGTMTTWYETVFNIYSDPNGRIYGCYWQKYPFGYLNKHGTSDGISP